MCECNVVASMPCSRKVINAEFTSSGVSEKSPVARNAVVARILKVHDLTGTSGVRLRLDAVRFRSRPSSVERSHIESPGLHFALIIVERSRRGAAEHFALGIVYPVVAGTEKAVL